MKTLSVVTVHLDDFRGLETTRASLAHLLDDHRVEWIVVDGGSKSESDSERRLFESVRSAADTFIAGPDHGPYDAMNKGTAAAGGEYVLYLNAGDELNPDLDSAELFAAMETGAEMIWGTCVECYENGARVELRTRPPRFAWYGMPVNHQNILFRRDRLGEAPYDLNYEIAADYALIGRLLKEGASVELARLPIALFHRGGKSVTRFGDTLAEEHRARIEHHGVPAPLSVLLREFRRANARLARLTWLRRLWRKWI